MKKSPIEKVNLPYAAGVANYFNDQGSVLGNSFLGRIFSGRVKPPAQFKNFAPPAAPIVSGPAAGIANGAQQTSRNK